MLEEYMPMSAPRVSSWILVTLLALSWACGGGGGGGSVQPPSESNNLAFAASTLAEDFNQVELTWSVTRPPEAFRLEIRLDGDPYSPGNSVEVPGNTRGALITFDDDLPEMSVIWFRLSTLQGGQPLKSMETSVRRTMRPVQLTSLEYLPRKGSVVIAWTTDPRSSATKFKVERMVGSAPWAQVGEVQGAEPHTEFSFENGGCEDGTDYRYRVSPLADQVVGFPMVATITTPILPPQNLEVTQRSAEGTTLTWQNQSKGAVFIRVIRQEWLADVHAWGPEQILGTLPSSITGYSDPVASQTSVLAYRVEAGRDENLRSSSNWTLTGGPTDMPTLGLSRRYLSFPFRPLYRDTDDGWIGAGYSYRLGPTEIRILRSPEAPGFPLDLAFSRGETAYNQVDLTFGSSKPGKLFVATVETAGSLDPLTLTLHHASVGNWVHQAPKVLTDASALQGGFGEGGEYSAFVLRKDWSAGFLGVTKDGIEVQDGAPTMSGGRTPPWTLPDGSALALVQQGSEWVTAGRAPEGGWQLNPIEVPTGFDWAGVTVHQVTLDHQGTLHAFLAKAEVSGIHGYYLRKPMGGAAHVEVMWVDRAQNWGTVFSLAVNAAGDRVAISKVDDSGLLEIAFRGATSEWEFRTAQLLDAQVEYRAPFLMTGFQADGRFWLLHDEIRNPGNPGGHTIFELLQEPQSPPVQPFGRGKVP